MLTDIGGLSYSDVDRTMRKGVIIAGRAVREYICDDDVAAQSITVPTIRIYVAVVLPPSHYPETPVFFTFSQSLR